MAKGTAERTVGITGYFVTLPHAKYILIAIMVLGVLFGITINMASYGGVDLLLKGALDGVTLLSLPAAISSVAIKLMIRKVPFRRILGTTFIGEVIYALAYGAGFFLGTINPFYAELIVLTGVALVFVLWYSIARLIFVLRFRSILFAVIQLLFHLVFLLSSSALYTADEPLFSVAKFYLAAFVLLLAMLIFFFIINRPFKKSFGVSGTDTFSHVIGQWFYQDTKLEETFESVGQEARTIVSFIGFKRKADEIFFVIPCVHFGPFGTLGGSEFSYLIPRELSKKYGAKVLTFHGTATHDLNPVSSSELSKVIEACDACIKRGNYKATQVGLGIAQDGGCTAEALLCNEDAFIGLTRAPQVTEDINFGVGLAIAKEAEKYAGVVGIADQHNAETGEITSFEPGDIVGYHYMRAVTHVFEQKVKRSKLEVGYSERHFEYPFIGKAGIKVVVFSTTPEYVLILIDSNGLAPHVREHIISEVKDAGKKYGKTWHVAVYTTDTHQINLVRGVLNPMRQERALVDEIKTAALEAMFDMQPAQSFAEQEWFDIKVIGPKQSIEIASTINAMVAVAKIIGPVILLGGIVALLLLLRTIG